LANSSHRNREALAGWAPGPKSKEGCQAGSVTITHQLWPHCHCASRARAPRPPPTPRPWNERRSMPRSPGEGSSKPAPRRARQRSWARRSGPWCGRGVHQEARTQAHTAALQRAPAGYLDRPRRPRPWSARRSTHCATGVTYARQPQLPSRSFPRSVRGGLLHALVEFPDIRTSGETAYTSRTKQNGWLNSCVVAGSMVH
jgi:hypothetical protein